MMNGINLFFIKFPLRNQIKWSFISDHMRNTRSASQCCKRWNGVLQGGDTTLSNIGIWTPEEVLFHVHVFACLSPLQFSTG
jgi:hypothetical protein